MKIGMFTSGYQRNPMKDMFLDASRFGYDYIELWGARPHAYPPDLKREGVAALRTLMDRHQMPVVGFTPETNAYPYNFMQGTEAMAMDSVEYIKLSMDVARELGADFTLISAGHGGYAATERELWDRLTRCLRELVAHGEKIRHKIVLEALTPYESNVITTANGLARALELFPSEYLVGMCDVVPPYVQSESILAYLDKLGDKMHHMHLVDSDGTSDTHLVPGEGKMPLRELLAELKERRYDRTLTIELVTNYLGEPRLYTRRAIDNLRRLMEE